MSPEMSMEMGIATKMKGSVAREKEFGTCKGCASRRSTTGYETIPARKYNIVDQVLTDFAVAPCRPVTMQFGKRTAKSLAL